MEIDTTNNINDDLWAIHVMPNARLCSLVSCAPHLNINTIFSLSRLYHRMGLDLGLEILHFEVDSLHVPTCYVAINITEAASSPLKSFFTSQR